MWRTITAPICQMCPEAVTVSSPDNDQDHPARRLGRKLREARIAAGYRSQQEFGTTVSMHRTAVTKIENGTRHISPDLLRKWCELCHVDFELFEASARLAWVAESSPVPLWFEDFRKAQVLAHTIRTWHPVIVPGPLQVPGYARVLAEVTGTPDDLIDERVAARIDLQQQTIERRPVPVNLLAVMDESVLHRDLGSEEIRYKQLVHLADQGRRRHIGIQVVPAGRGVNAGHVGAFTIASLDGADVLLMGAIEDVTTDNRSAVRGGLAIFDRVRLAALSGPESVELIMKAAEECRP
jgi:transcriptional regulator with XRE-family HTH domain